MVEGVNYPVLYTLGKLYTVECCYTADPFTTILHGTTMTAVERQSDFLLTGELWGVYCDDLGENWPRYNGTAL